MQALRILPLLMSMLAMAISLFAGVWPDPLIMAADLPILSPVQAIISAEAGVRDSAESMAAAIKSLFMGTSPGIKPACCWQTRYDSFPPDVSGSRYLCMPRCGTEPDLPLRRRADTPGRGLGLARGLAAIGGLAFVDVAGEPVDQPDIVVVRTVHADESGADSRNQRRQQDRRRDDGRANQYRYRASWAIRHDRAILAVSF